ncbi:hypothetical protein M405DRAFT_884979 [Rhizopogon salebrosus TDB-379]|nr:hypothetical protein M405DRAFT_884979 [Rhizopogon salebrosus TDB-379]
MYRDPLLFYPSHLTTESPLGPLGQTASCSINIDGTRRSLAAGADARGFGVDGRTTFLRHFGRSKYGTDGLEASMAEFYIAPGALGVLVSDKLCSHCSTVDGAMDNLARMDLAKRDIRIPLYMNVYLARGDVEPSNVNGIDLTATSARENVATLESASNISASQMMLTTPSRRPCMRNSSRWHPIRLRPRAAVSSTV